VCTIEPGGTVGSCGQPEQCPGACDDNTDCREQGGDACVCFLGISTVNDDLVAHVIAEGNGGACGECRGAGQSCDASTECCGQLICRNGTCARKRQPKPKRNRKRCAKHGHGCSQDGGCCAQAICYRGRCGEKDTHCDSDRECARGYTCVGGQLTGGHRRCRRKGRKRPRNRRNRG
ncbi:MAG: Dickkopf N-terminal cysteine-rich domain-containing protein, partial [Thermomicrobiales bacterium]